MKIISKCALVLAATAMLPMGAAQARDWDRDRYRHRHDHNDSAAAGAVIGLAIVGLAAAAAAKRKKDQDRYYEDRQWGSTFSPARDVICYRQERQCYYRNHYNFEWTESQFGYDPYRRGY